MTLKTGLAPHYRKDNSVRHMMVDTVVALALLLVIPTVYNGFRVISMVALSCAACAVGEILFCMFTHREIMITEFSPMVTGTIIAMLMPVTAPLWLPVVAALFASIVAKEPFGGTGNNPFNPAAAGVAFAIICWPDLMFSFRNGSVSAALPMFADCDFTAVVSPAGMLKQGLRPQILSSQMLTGNFTGPMGTTAVIVILACALYIFIKRTAHFTTSLCFLGTAAALAAAFPRIVGTRPESVFFELFSGSLVFAAVFMATDPVTSPKTPLGRCIYGGLGGIAAMLFRYFGAYEEGVVFAILFINALAPAIDRFVWRLKQKEARSHAG